MPFNYKGKESFINFYRKTQCTMSCLECDTIMRIKSVRPWQNPAIPFTAYIFNTRNLVELSCTLFQILIVNCTDVALLKMAALSWNQNKNCFIIRARIPKYLLLGIT